MIKDTKISGYQLGMLIMGFLFGSSAVMNPTIQVGQDSWLAYSLGLVLGLGLIWLYVKLSLMNQAQTLVEILKAHFGKYLGTLVSLLYIWYFVHLAALVLRNYGEHMAVTVYFDTPNIFLMSCFAFLVGYCLRSGLEVMARAAEMLMPYLFLFLLIIFLLLIGEYDPQNIFPILENGWAPVLKASFSLLTFPFGETVAFLMKFPALYSAKNLKKVTMLSSFLMSLILLGVTLRDLLSLGPDIIVRLVFPPSLSTELIPELQLEPLISVNLLLGGWIKITICLFAAAIGIAQLLNSNDYRIFSFPLSLLCVVMATWLYEDVFQMLDWAFQIYPFYALPMQIIIPILLLVISKVKNLSKNKA